MIRHKDIKVRLKRVSRKPGCSTPSILDHKFVDGTIITRPKKGESLVFCFTRIDDNLWVTTPVKEIVKLKTVTSVKTSNSIYHVKKGWTKLMLSKCACGHKQFKGKHGKAHCYLRRSR